MCSMSAHSRSGSTILLLLVLLLVSSQADGVSKGKRSKKDKDKDKDSSNLLVQLNRRNIKDYVSSATLPPTVLYPSPAASISPQAWQPKLSKRTMLLCADGCEYTRYCHSRGPGQFRRTGECFPGAHTHVTLSLLSRQRSRALNFEPA